MPLLETPLPGLLYRGKVRDTFDLGDGLFLMVATDRISAFDVVLPNGIPEKENFFLLNGVGGGGSAVGSDTAIAGIVMKPWSERHRSTKEVVKDVTAQSSQVAGLQSRHDGRARREHTGLDVDAVVLEEALVLGQEEARVVGDLQVPGTDDGHSGGFIGGGRAGTGCEDEPGGHYCCGCRDGAACDAGQGSSFRVRNVRNVR